MQCTKNRVVAVRSADASNDIRLSRLTTAIRQDSCGDCYACNATEGLEDFLIHLYAYDELRNI